MSDVPFDAEAYMAAAATALGLSLNEAWKPGVLDNLKRSHQIAQGFLGFALPDETEPASRFEP
jgi:hypothetical protein